MFSWFRKVSVDCKIISQYYYNIYSWNNLIRSEYYLTLQYKDMRFTIETDYGVWSSYKKGDTIKYKIRKKYV